MKKIINFFKTNKKFSFCLTLDKLAEFFYLLAIFSLPIYLSFFLQTEHPIELNKVFLFKLLLILLFFATTLREIIFPSKTLIRLKEIFFKYWFWPSIFIVFFLLSLIYSGDPILSFWGTVDRQMGALSYLLYFSFFILLSFNLIVFSQRRENKKKSYVENEKADNIFYSPELRRIVWTIFFSSLVVSLYGVLQYLGIDYYQWMEPAYLTGRSFSFLGQPNFFASWLVLVIPLLVFLVFLIKNNYLRFFTFLVSLLSVIALITTSSRAAFVALIATFFIFIFLIFSFSKFKSSYKKFTILLVALFVFLSFVFALKLALPERMNAMIDFKGGSVSARVDFYKSSLLAIKEKPLLGYGQENLYAVFMSDYQSHWANHSHIGQTPDKAHNLILDILMTSGFVGLIFYFLLYRYYFLLVYRNIKRDKLFSLSLVLGLGGLAYLISLLFGFAVVVTEFYFFIFLALLVFINYYLEEEKESEAVPRSSVQEEFIKSGRKEKAKKIFLTSVLVLICSIFLLRTVQTLFADYYFAEARARFNKGDFHEAMTLLDYIDKLEINPIAKSYYAEASSVFILPLFPYEQEQVLNSFFKQRLATSFLDLRESQPKELLMKARISSAFKDFEQSDGYLNRFKEQYPTWPLGILSHAKIKMLAGEKEEALERLNYLLSIIADPNNEVVNEEHRQAIKNLKQETLYIIAQIHESEEDYAAAEKYYRLVYLENPLNHSLLKKVADMLYLQNNYSQALVEVERGMRLSPEDYNWPLLASYLYQQTGKLDMAKNLLERAQELGFIAD